MLDELEERRLRPVDVVEDEDERPLARARLAELPEEPGELGRGRRRLGVERGEDRVALRALVRLLEHFAQRPVRDALAVGEAAAPERRDALRAAGQLGGEPRLPDAGRADDDGDAHGRAVDRALQRSAERGELALAADERRVQAPLERGRDRAHLEQAVRAHRLALALDLERAERLERGGVVDQPTRELADDDLVRVGRCSSRAAIADGLAGDEALPRVGRRRDDLAGLDPDPHLEPDPVLADELLVERRDPDPDVERGARGAKRVVLVRDRDAEGGHDRVARELLHRAAVPREGRRDRLEVAPQDAPERLRIERLRERHRLDDVDEEDRDEPAELHRRPGERCLLEQQRLVLAENRGLELAELRAGVDPELLDEGLARGAVGGERVGLPCRSGRARA